MRSTTIQSIWIGTSEFYRTCYMQTGEISVRDVYKGISFLLILMGIARSSPPAIVIGLQQSHTSGAGIGGEISWHDVRQVSLYPKEHVVLLKERWFAGGLGGGLRAIRLYCTPENYEAVAAMSSEYSKKP